MKTILFLILLFLFPVFYAQDPRVVVFKHELRWTDEAKFPNYFMLPWIQDSIYYLTRIHLKNYLSASDVNIPVEVEYKIIPGFSKQKIELPDNLPKGITSIGVFSFITRATVGMGVIWKFNILISKNNKIVYKQEVEHELEYFSSAGYLGSQLWMNSEEFITIFDKLLKESLGIIPISNEKLTLGSFEAIEKEAGALLQNPVRTLFKINGAWKSAGSFAGALDNENGAPPINFTFNNGITWQLPSPSLSGVLGGVVASLLTEITGVDFAYQQKIKNRIIGSVNFENDQKFAIKLEWIDFQLISPTTGNTISTTVSRPCVAEVYNEKEQTGAFVYKYVENIHQTTATIEKWNAFSGHQIENSLGIERVHSIEGIINGYPIYGEFNEAKGIITIKSGENTIGAMVVHNCNPESRSVSGQRLSENKTVVSGSYQTIGKKSIENINNVEWYSMYLNDSLTIDS